MKFITYYRVSTKRQGQSGLGIEAQKEAVKRYCQGGEVVAEYTEVESGKRDNRVELKKALAHCKEIGATLVVAKLDRLSRNASFLFALKDAAVDFICCDCPQLDTLNLAVQAGLAQREREMISERTRAALAAKKARGGKLGNPQNFTREVIAKGQRAHVEQAKEKKENRQAYALIQALRASGCSLNGIAKKLNGAGYRTANGKEYLHTTVSYLLRMFEGSTNGQK